MKLSQEMQILKNSILDDCKSFFGKHQWIGGHSFGILKGDTYRIFDIPVHIDYVLDIGTCLGEVSYACSKIFPSAYIVAVEARPQTFEFAIENLKGTGVIVEHHGISETDGEPLYITEEAKNNIGALRTKTSNDDQCNCRSISFETLLKKHSIDLSKNCLLKIDCEGCERWVFDKPNICQQFYQVSCEIHDPKKDHMRETIEVFYEKMQLTHDVIKGTCNMGSRPEIVFRKKSTPVLAKMVSTNTVTKEEVITEFLELEGSWEPLRVVRSSHDIWKRYPSSDGWVHWWSINS